MHMICRREVPIVSRFEGPSLQLSDCIQIAIHVSVQYIETTVYTIRYETCDVLYQKIYQYNHAMGAQIAVCGVTSVHTV